MLKGFEQYPISFWGAGRWSDLTNEKVDTWCDLGITLAMMPCKLDEKDKVLGVLDHAATRGLKVILEDPRANWAVINRDGEDAYRAGMAEAIRDFGKHPAMYGFYIGDEPNGKNIDNALLACRINREMAPHLTAYLNLLPWLSWIGPSLGTEEYGPYLDRVAREGQSALISYDCYMQMLDDKEEGWRDYFNNLREHYEASKRNGVPFMNIVLSCGHYAYRCPSKDDMLWQLTTSVAHGASAVSWFVIELTDVPDNYRNPPINQLGDRTEQFGWLREVNCVFNNYCGRVINTLTIDTCYHVGTAYGGMPMFEPFDSILEITSGVTPLIVSGFHNEAGEKFYMVCNNSTDEVTYASLKIKAGVCLSRCQYGNVFSKVHALTDPVGERMGNPEQSYGFPLAPGQLVLFREDKAE